MEHIRGDTFDYVAIMDATIPDGAFVGFVPSCQLRDPYGNLIDDVVTTWVDPLTTRSIGLHVTDTSEWKIGPAVYDIQLRRTSDGYTRSTHKGTFDIIEDVTRP